MMFRQIHLIKLEQSDEISSSDMSNENVDLVNSINSITNDGNNIIVKFNRDYSKKDVKYDSYKNKDSFENVFEIKVNINTLTLQNYL